MSAAINPVQNRERIWLMDALRGFAVLGIFIANLGSGFAFYNSSAPNTGPFFSSFDGTMSFLHHMLIEGKFYSIFSFLFGWGIALQLSRNNSNGAEPISLVRRRLLIMILLGLSHIILLWIGDIVAFYGMVGFVLLLMRKWKDKTLLITAVVLMLSPILLYFIKMNWPPASAPSNLLRQAGIWTVTQLTNINSDESYIAYIRNAQYPDLVKLNLAGFFFRYSDLFFQSRISKVLALFILGYLMGRNGRYKQILANTKLLWTVAILGFVIGLPANYQLGRYMEDGGRAYYSLQQQGLYRTIVYALGVAPLACAFIASFFLLARTALGATVMSWLRPVGKMAFSNYIMHSIIGTFVFLPMGLGLMGKVGPVYYTLFALLVFIVQIFISKIWLHYFEFGPVEWLWRSATYNKKQQFRRKEEIALVTP
jgi:uncharacterized protein